MPDSRTVSDSTAPANLAGLLRRAAEAGGDEVALVAGPRRISWAELDALVDDAARGLAARGLAAGGPGGPGDRVAMLAANSPEFVVVYLGALRAGLVVAPLNTAAPAPEVTAALVETGARLLVADLATEAVARAATDAQGCDVLVVGGTGPDGLAALLAADGPVPTPATGGEDLAVLLQTAGTGGRPKRAMLSHRALLANLDQCARLTPAPVAAGDVVLLALPLFHVFGLNAVLGQVLHAGATAVIADGADIAGTLRVVAESGVTSIAGAPPMFAAWAARPEAREALAGVRLLVSGASPLQKGGAAAFREATGKPLRQGYGMTEAAPVVTAGMRAKEGSVGRPLPGVELRLLDLDGQEVAEDDPGEVVVRGANLFSGYWPDGSDGPGPDGWFSTGDVAYADPDGDLFMVSTRPDLVIVNGFNVYPREVEDVLGLLPGVAEAAVIGVPDERTGQAVKALVVPAPGATVEPAEVRAFCAVRLARFKVPSLVEIVADLPRSVTGKLARGQLRSREGRLG
jgi:long-chain acyl-CoA synthetase